MVRRRGEQFAPNTRPQRTTRSANDYIVLLARIHRSKLELIWLGIDMGHIGPEHCLCPTDKQSRFPCQR